MRSLSKRKSVIFALLAVFGVLLVYPQKIREYEVTKTGPITHIRQGFDGGFVEVEVGSIIFDDPIIHTSTASVVPISHLHVGQFVRATGKWVDSVPWWKSKSPAPPHVVTLTRLTVVKSKRQQKRT